VAGNGWEGGWLQTARERARGSKGRKEGFVNVVTDNRQPSQPTNYARSTSAFAL
jgi:hypothetical protein